MIIQSVTLEHFRNVGSASLSFCEGGNLIFGENAQGKTNLLEAISLISVGKSFRTNHDGELLQLGEKSFSVSAVFEKDGREQDVSVLFEKGRKHFTVNHCPLERLRDLPGNLRTVLFAPEHLSLLQSGPAMRRRFLDIALSQLYPNYIYELQRHNGILTERNALLKSAENDKKALATLSYWSELLAGSACVLSRYRMEYLHRLQPILQEIIAELSGGRETVSLFYRGSAHLEEEEYADESLSRASFLRLLTENTERELSAGTTLWGCHRDDFDLFLCGNDARIYASQGQQRSLALALKLGEGILCFDICNEQPVYLLDDVFSELDANRRAYLSSKITGKQIIMTGCDDMPDFVGKRIFVQNGTYREQ